MSIYLTCNLDMEVDTYPNYNNNLNICVSTLVTHLFRYIICVEIRFGDTMSGCVITQQALCPGFDSRAVTTFSI